MKAETPRIAVIIPAYNSAAYLAETLRSVLHQSLAAAEIVVVDDGSSDATATVAGNVSAKITVIQQKNSGQGSARQHGALVATAEWLLFLDADDVLYPACLEKLAAALLAQPQAALAYCRAELWSPMSNQPTTVDTLDCPTGSDVWDKLLHGNCIRTPGCALIRRTAFEAVGGWDEDVQLKGNEDWELWLRLAENREVVAVPEPLLKYRLHSTGFSHNRNHMFRSLFVLFAKHRARWAAQPSRLQAVETGEWQNCKSVVEEIWHAAQAAGAKGQLGVAIHLLLEALRLGTRPLLRRVRAAARR